MNGAKRETIDLINIDTSISIPIYKQIVQSIHKNIEQGVLLKNDPLPSVNKIAEKFALARGSVFSAYNDLRASGIIDSIPGKGYFVSSTHTNQKHNIFLLFSTFTPYKETLYNALHKHLPATSSLDIYFHHHNMKVFESLIREQAGYYNRFIIMPEIHEDTSRILKKLDSRNTYMLDVGFGEYKDLFPGVYQNFEKDIYALLSALTKLICKYKRLFLLYPNHVKSKDILSGFNKFAKKKTIDMEVKPSVSPSEIQKHDAFIVIEDNHLVDLVNLVKKRGWELGKDIGIMSYNETSLKSVIADGITTITTDFGLMGATIAEMVVEGKREVIENPFKMVDRGSF
jgi:DNA-binding transcriptional regulator YhcF (GntR family)